jgi:hypothetical protein
MLDFFIEGKDLFIDLIFIIFVSLNCYWDMVPRTRDW